MISRLFPLMVGNAVRVFVTPPRHANCWRVLRRTADAFTGPNDTGAVVVADLCQDNVILDTTDLVNGTAYFWRDYTSVDGGMTWVDSGVSATATPAATYEDTSSDPQSLVIERMILGMAVEVAKGNLAPAEGIVPVYSAPFGVADAMTFPCISIHADNTSGSDRVLSDDFGELGADLSGNWTDSEGWLQRTRLAVIGVSLNADERMALRKAILRVILANMPVFADAGLITPTFVQSDSEDLLGGSNAPLFRTNGTFECVSTAAVFAPVAPVTSISVTSFVGTDLVNV